MKAAISIEHPAWSHQFKNIIQRINEDGETLVLGVNKERDLELLDTFGIKYERVAESTGIGVLQKGWLFIKLCFVYTRRVRRFNPDILIGGASPMMAVAAWLTRKPHVIFEDTEVSKFSLNICRMFSTCIMTPQTFLWDLGKKHLRTPIYKELFYLHRDFKPNPDVLRQNGIDPDRPFALVRFVAWNASHDVGMRGLSDEDKIRFVKKVEELMPVYISSESELPEALKGYQYTLPFDQVHHLLYYATLVFSEGKTVASEAAMLGTYAFYLNQIESGPTNEQEARFQLLRCLPDPATRYETALAEATELLKDSSLWERGKEKRERLLDEMPNPNELYWNQMMEALSTYDVKR